MMKLANSILLFSVLALGACSEQAKKTSVEDRLPIVSNAGQTIRFSDASESTLFETQVISHRHISAAFTAPGKISASVVPSVEGASQNIVLFEDPELAGNYTQLTEHQINIQKLININIKQRQIELDRVMDLQAHGAASGKDLLEAKTALAIEQTNLANEKAALMEHEARLKSAGFNTELLRKSKVGTAYVICDIPENQISKIKEGNPCTIRFTSFPNQLFHGMIDDIAEVVDNTSRMVKLRSSLQNIDGQLKAGMFATVSFDVSEGNVIAVNKNALITVQGKTYVFIKTSANQIDRKEVQTGQQIGDEIIIYSGLQDGEVLVVKGAMQLKGLSFGY